jgi:hypothetical protein
MAARPRGSAPVRSRRSRWRHRAFAAAAIVVILTLLGLIVAHDESPYRNQPEAAVTVTDVEPGAGWKGSRRRGCESSWFHVTSDDGRTGYFRDCADRYWEGRWITVRWNPDRSGLVDPDTMLPKDIVTLNVVMAPMFFGMYVAGDWWRHSAAKQRLDDRVFRPGRRRVGRRRRPPRRKVPAGNRSRPPADPSASDLQEAGSGRHPTS